MKRTKTKSLRADLVFTGDIHLEETAPVSRIDDYEEAQKKKLAFLRAFTEKHDCPVIDAGDIFNHWKTSPYLITRAAEELPKEVYTIPGNHDLPNHNKELIHKSALGTLFATKRIALLSSMYANSFYGVSVQGLAYGDSTIPEPHTSSHINILVIHELIWEETKPPFPDAEGYSASEVLKRYKGFDIIVSGHNHSGFLFQAGNRFVVNPGSMMRISADKKDYKPRFYAMNIKAMEIWPVYYPIEPNVHDTFHLEERKAREARQQAFIQKINMDFNLALNFKDNLQTFFKKNRTPKKIEEVIWQSMD